MPKPARPLVELAFASSLPAEVAGRLGEMALPARFSAGSEIFREGSENRTLYVLQSGRVALEMFVPQRGRVRILTLEPGEMLSWSAAIGSGWMTATAVAVTDVEALAIPGDRLAEACQQDREFGYHVMRRLAESLAQRLLATRLQLLDVFLDESNAPSGGSPG